MGLSLLPAWGGVARGPWGLSEWRFRVGAMLTAALSVLEQVHRHLEQHEVHYLQFAFRWMNNLLTREVPLRCTVRLWDTYQVSPALGPVRAVAWEHALGWTAVLQRLFLVFLSPDQMWDGEDSLSCL